MRVSRIYRVAEELGLSTLFTHTVVDIYELKNAVEKKEELVNRLSKSKQKLGIKLVRVAEQFLKSFESGELDDLCMDLLMMYLAKVLPTKNIIERLLNAGVPIETFNGVILPGDRVDDTVITDAMLDHVRAKLFTTLLKYDRAYVDFENRSVCVGRKCIGLDMIQLYRLLRDSVLHDEKELYHGIMKRWGRTFVDHVLKRLFIGDRCEERGYGTSIECIVVHQGTKVKITISPNIGSVRFELLDVPESMKVLKIRPVHEGSIDSIDLVSTVTELIKASRELDEVLKDVATLADVFIVEDERSIDPIGKNWLFKRIGFKYRDDPNIHVEFDIERRKFVLYYDYVFKEPVQINIIDSVCRRRGLYNIDDISIGYDRGFLRIRYESNSIENVIEVAKRVAGLGKEIEGIVRRSAEEKKRLFSDPQVKKGLSLVLYLLVQTGVVDEDTANAVLGYRRRLLTSVVKRMYCSSGDEFCDPVMEAIANGDIRFLDDGSVVVFGHSIDDYYESFLKDVIDRSATIKNALLVWMKLNRLSPRYVDIVLKVVKKIKNPDTLIDIATTITTYEVFDYVGKVLGEIMKRNPTEGCRYLGRLLIGLDFNDRSSYFTTEFIDVNLDLIKTALRYEDFRKGYGRIILKHVILRQRYDLLGELFPYIINVKDAEIDRVSGTMKIGNVLLRPIDVEGGKIVWGVAYTDKDGLVVKADTAEDALIVAKMMYGVVEEILAQLKELESSYSNIMMVENVDIVYGDVSRKSYFVAIRMPPSVEMVDSGIADVAPFRGGLVRAWRVVIASKESLELLRRYLETVSMQTRMGVGVGEFA